jgi:hypothetical protein
MGKPGIGIGIGGLEQKQIGQSGLGVSSWSLKLTGTGPILMGNMQDQQISVMGFTNLPTQGFATLPQQTKTASTNITILLVMRAHIDLESSMKYPSGVRP